MGIARQDMLTKLLQIPADNVVQCAGRKRAGVRAERLADIIKLPHPTLRTHIIPPYTPTCLRSYYLLIVVVNRMIFMASFGQIRPCPLQALLHDGHRLSRLHSVTSQCKN